MPQVVANHINKSFGSFNINITVFPHGNYVQVLFNSRVYIHSSLIQPGVISSLFSTSVAINSIGDGLVQLTNGSGITLSFVEQGRAINPSVDTIKKISHEINRKYGKKTPANIPPRTIHLSKPKAKATPRTVEAPRLVKVDTESDDEFFSINSSEISE